MVIQCRMMFEFKSFLILLFIKSTFQDIYLHNPRGSNNRLNERSATRTNNNRLFDSQNNARGGYNVGDATSQPFQTEIDQYQMRYFQSGIYGKSYLTMEWTDQHGCGGDANTDPTKQNCQLILQYMCQDVSVADTDLDRLRDGLNTASQDYTQMGTDTKDAHAQRKANNVKTDRGLHETWDSYDKCRYRERNNGLFIADRNLRKIEKGYSSAIHTRQNENGDRSGYECPEERDYYPYWHPTVFKDIAILTSNVTLCEQLYKKYSFNVYPYNECVEFYADKTRKHWSRYNNEADCVKNNGRWIQFYNYLEKASQFQSQPTCESKSDANYKYKWGVPHDATDVDKSECLVLLSAPVCQQAEWTRSNHLGNKRDATAANFTWTLPRFPSNTQKKCFFRIRYNISTDDYDPFRTDAKYNGDKSPVKQNPLISVGDDNHPLRLAIDTAQYGRVFQDRSHTFYLLPRSNDIPDNVFLYNLNVRGKRGNIVQVYPGVEYDFVPNWLSIGVSDYVHIQWTGSNTHNNDNPGGDGQTGNDGNGNAGTDRSNFVQINLLNDNYPLPYESSSIWNNIKLIGLLNPNDQPNLNMNSLSSSDLALYFASSGYYKCAKAATCGDSSYETKPALDSDLNNATASFPGAVVKFTRSNSIFNYMCSRNNNFSNRSQKGSIIVS